MEGSPGKDPPCADVELPAAGVRQQGAAPLDRSSGGRESGSNTYQNPETGETRTVAGTEAGRSLQQSGSEEGFAHDTRPESAGGSRPDGWETPLLSHTHLPSRSRAASRARQSRGNNAPSDIDQSAMNQSGAAIQIVGPAVTGTLYGKTAKTTSKLTGEARKTSLTLRRKVLLLFPNRSCRHEFGYGLARDTDIESLQRLCDD